MYLAGQITGVEGYLESAACGLWLGLSLAHRLQGREVAVPPRETALGALLGHLRTEPDKEFQPSNVNFGLMPGLEKKMKKKLRKEAYGRRAQEAFAVWIEGAGFKAVIRCLFFRLMAVISNSVAMGDCQFLPDAAL